MSVTGSVNPLNANSAVVEFAELTVTLDPLAVKVPLLVAVWPTITLPKSMAPGFTESCPAAVADPDNPIPSDELDAFDVNVSVPDELPLAVGAKTTPNVTLCPTASVVGSVRPLTLNAADDTPACVMFTLDPPLFFTV